MAGTQAGGQQARQRPLFFHDKTGFVFERLFQGGAPARPPAVTLRQALAWSRFFAESARQSPFRRGGRVSLGR